MTTRIFPRVLQPLLVAGCILLTSWQILLAHEVRPSIINLNLQESGYQLDILLNLEAIIADIGTEHEDTDLSENAWRYNELRALPAQQLSREFDRFAPEFLDAVSVTSEDGHRIEHDVIEIEIPEPGDLSIARDSRLVLAPVTPLAAESIIWSWPARFGDNIIRVNQADGEARDDDYSAFLTGGGRSAPIPLTGDVGLRTVEVVWNYLRIGFSHILPKGLDHILFVVGLFLLSPTLRPLLIQVTSFTVAHTVTLALGATGLVTLPASIVEPLIAASIVYVAVENMISDKLQKWRPMVVFGFGLLHGLGFAGVLSEVGIASGFFITALVAFNIGVELGQLAVILICFLLAGFWFRQRAWYRAVITIPGSLAVAAMGLYWFIDRIS